MFINCAPLLQTLRSSSLHLSRNLLFTLPPSPADMISLVTFDPAGRILFGSYGTSFFSSPSSLRTFAFGEWELNRGRTSKNAPKIFFDPPPTREERISLVERLFQFQAIFFATKVYNIPVLWSLTEELFISYCG